MWYKLQIFGFRALWSPYFLIFVLMLGVVYYLITGPYRHKFGGIDKPTGKQKLFFYMGLVILYIIKGSPIDLLSHIMLTAHMVQMVFLYLVFPIFIIKGIPAWLWEKFINLKGVKPVFNLLTKPLVALLSFNVLFSLYHMPVIFDFSKSSKLAHAVILLILLFAAFLMWWPLMSPIKRYDTLKPLLKMAYLVASAAIITIACALIIFASSPVYEAYTSEGAWIQAMSICVPSDVLDGIAVSISGPEMFSPLSILYDQQLGGIVMKFMQEIIYGIIIAKTFFSWFSKKNMESDPLPSTDFSKSHS
ncbi:MAG TPA: cytochrome c oxidase assembly factor CtaG [Bacillota bacterium]|nr:cytochrome c oxidase assembly factor CtaG [Bacillota bacterium]